MEGTSLRRTIVSTLLVFVAATVIGVGVQFISLPYYIISPGSALAVTPYIEVPDERSHPHEGDVLLTTVSVARAHPYNWLWAYLTPHNRIVKEKDLIGDSTPKQYFEANALSMEESKTTATYVAMRRAGYDVTYLGDGATVQAVSPGSPAESKLHVGETITSVDGQPVQRAGDIGAKIRPLTPGTTIHLDIVDAGGSGRTVEVVTAAHPADSALSFIGVSVKTKNPHLQAPFDVELKTERIGGPSAGLAFTLSALDELTPGDMTGGKKVAVTGTIDTDGSVGQVGGVEQKMQAVKKSGAKLFLVPAAEVDEVKKSAGDDVEVVGVDDLEDALAALQAHGGDITGIPAQAAMRPAS